MAYKKPTKKRKSMKQVRRKHPIAKRAKGSPRRKPERRIGHGFRAEEITPDQWVLGSALQIEGPILCPDGQWDEYLPVEEIQHRSGFDTMNCTNYGSLNAWEILAYKVCGIKFNWSERYTGVGTGTTKVGNYPHKVNEIIRKEIGLIDEALLPFDDTITSWNKYYSPKPMDPALLARGKRFLNKYELGHDWVFVNGTPEQKAEKMVEALKYSPVCASVDAWRKRRSTGLYFKDKGGQDNHWGTIYGYVEGEYWKFFDHYDETHKRLEWKYDFAYAKRYCIKLVEKGNENTKLRLWALIWEGLKKFFRDMRANQK